MNDTIDEKPTRVISTTEQFYDWLKFANPGDRVVYHTGYLAADRLKKEEFLNDSINYMAIAVWNAYERGKVTLFQCRDKVNSVHYVAVRLREKTK